jgi:CRP/FNR family transcriptional regulator, cyclic AMP receptor protein
MNNSYQEHGKGSGLDRFLVTFEPGEIIFFEGDLEDFAFMVKHGKIRLIRIINNVEKFVGTVSDGDFLGEMAILANTTRSATAIAVEATHAYKISKANFDLLVANNISMAIKILTLSADRIARQRRQLQVLLLRDPETQILDTLVMLYERMGITQKEQVTISITPYELTTWAGLSMDKSRRVLASYQESKRISVFPDRIVVHSINELERIIAARRKAQSTTTDGAPKK